jgi:hypothetical protein
VPARGRVCEIVGCGREHASRGLCTGHYGRLIAKGDPQPESAAGQLPDPTASLQGRGLRSGGGHARLVSCPLLTAAALW